MVKCFRNEGCTLLPPACAMCDWESHMNYLPRNSFTHKPDKMDTCYTMDVDWFCLAHWNDMKNLRITKLHVLVCVHKFNPPCFDSFPCATEWIAESKRFEFFGGIPSKYFSLLCARRLFMNVYNDFPIKSQIAKWWNKRLFQATCIHPNSSYISDTRSISLQTICHDDIGNWWVLIDPRKGWCPQQQNLFVGWNVVISTTTINIREGVLKSWHDGVR